MNFLRGTRYHSSIYLSGGMQHAKNFGSGWRVEMGERLRHLGYYPIDICAFDRAYAAEYGELYNMTDLDLNLQYKSNMRKHFIHTDIDLVVRDSDALVVLYDESVRKGAGTISECQEAYMHDIPVFVISTYEDWAKEVPGWLQGLSTKIFTNFDDFYDYLSELPSGIFTRDTYGNHGVNGKYLCSLCGSVFNKDNHHFVSKVSPLYCKPCVNLVEKTYEGHVDRYRFCMEVIEKDLASEQVAPLVSPTFIGKVTVPKGKQIAKRRVFYEYSGASITADIQYTDVITGAVVDSFQAHSYSMAELEEHINNTYPLTTET